MPYLLITSLGNQNEIFNFTINNEKMNECVVNDYTIK